MEQDPVENYSEGEEEQQFDENGEPIQADEDMEMNEEGEEGMEDNDISYPIQVDYCPGRPPTNPNSLHAASRHVRVHSESQRLLGLLRSQRP